MASTVGVPIADYGLLGDTRTAALASSAGSVDWLCAPSFDGTPVFGALVGGERSGSFAVGPQQAVPPVTRRYRRGTATLETEWEANGGRLLLEEAMVAETAGTLAPASVLVRRLSASRGPVEVSIMLDPRPGGSACRWSRRGAHLVAEAGRLALSFSADAPLAVRPGAPSRAVVVPGRPLTLVLSIASGEPLVLLDPAAAWDLVAADEERWRAWSAEVDDDLPHREAVVRSLLTLRLLSFSPSGAPVAAPTTSLPEEPGGLRNWDYRYTWPRDASLGARTFLAVGKGDDAARFLGWLLHASRLDRPRLPALLTLWGTPVPTERTLPGWPGYRGSEPVRVGNLAAAQHQLDGYGWVLDAAWASVEAGHPLSSEMWRAMRSFADYVAARWQDPDAGIWEVRGAPAHHVHSKVMAWVALDRALRIASRQGARARKLRRWQEAREGIEAEVRARGIHPSTGSYRRAYGSDDPDAALLMLPGLGFEDPGSPRLAATVERIGRELAAGGPLLYRYPPGRDGLPGGEGAFLPCSFWMVEALAVTGRRGEAESAFEDLLRLATPLGLYGEEMDPETLEQLGNFPQCLTHAALVQAAIALRAADSPRSPAGA
ncbi:GH15 family glucan-1,4-alpha-glucosidase [Sinomonas atrocyanea]|uniref:glycoside hydrolase family 15 protein n=1 Tax=Sinomonas atrocyanea TaxID=37927 RepID=UPI002786B922|nr:glycoside hydrolase family 15 protein [Sinomonas atrocyanea]MDQ0261145.1 GH15 family glucan-1,4-alpha-glucosidase [Sinomonas atrocyanea]